MLTLSKLITHRVVILGRLIVFTRPNAIFEGEIRLVIHKDKLMSFSRPNYSVPNAFYIISSQYVLRIKVHLPQMVKFKA